MKKRKLIPVYFGLLFSVFFGCIDDSENEKVKELESLLLKTGVVQGAMGLSKIRGTDAIMLYESIENKELLIPEISKVMSTLYLQRSKLDKALIIMDKYIEQRSNDGEALFYKGLILKEKKLDYCEYFKRSKELGYKVNMAMKFMWYLENDPCI